jgi:sulfur carrier protein ThiS
LNWYDKDKRTWFEISPGKTTRLGDLISQLGIPRGEVAVALVNGRVADPETSLVQDTDVVELFPPTAGG